MNRNNKDLSFIQAIIYVFFIFVLMLLVVWVGFVGYIGYKSIYIVSDTGIKPVVEKVWCGSENCMEQKN